jgi:arabinan endo-1,5-alpha-L-arabinosidase
MRAAASHRLIAGLIASAVVMMVSPAGAAPRETPRLRGFPPKFHDPSTPIEADDVWHVFVTGNGIETRTSRDLKQWAEGKPVFETPPAWHRELVPENRGHLWAPDIIRRGDRYLLYYSVSSWGKNVSAIGLASNVTLDPNDPKYLWKDEGPVIRTSGKEDYNAIDPQILAASDGRLWMVFGSFWSGIQLVELDPESGLRHPERSRVRRIAWNETIEAAAILERGGYYYLFVNWGLCCRGLESTYEIRVGRGNSVTGPFLDKSGNDLATGGGSLLTGFGDDEIGPGHPCFVTQDGRTVMFYHYYDRKRRGFASIGYSRLAWTRDGWPELAK